MIFVCYVVSSDWSTVVSKASWHCIVLLGQLTWSTHFTLCCPTSWMLSGFFFTFILVELMKCQCSAASLASVLDNMDSGMFIMLKI